MNVMVKSLLEMIRSRPSAANVVCLAVVWHAAVAERLFARHRDGNVHGISVRVVRRYDFPWSRRV